MTLKQGVQKFALKHYVKEVEKVKLFNENLSYREKLLELSKIYKISEIQNYIRSKKHLTTFKLNIF